MDSLINTLRPADVLAGLASPDLATRDEATRAAIGASVIGAPALLAWRPDDLPSHRARRLWTYVGVHLRRVETRVRHPRPLAVRHAGTLRSALDAIGVLVGVPVGDVDNPDARVAIDLAETTLRGALDAACAQAGCLGGQGRRGELVARRTTQPPFPAAYCGPLRLRIVELATTRTTDFATTSATAQARARIDWEWPCNPASPVDLDFGASVRVSSSTLVDREEELAIHVDSPADPLELAGAAFADFDRAYDDVRVAMPGGLERHGIAIEATAGDGGGMLVIEARDPHRVRADRGILALSPVVLAIAADGQETLPQIHRVRSVGANTPTPSERWGLRLPDGFPAIAELRMRVAAPPIRARFELRVPPLRT
jgi:hypothetical protein